MASLMTPDLTIRILVSDVFGRSLAYPFCERAALFAGIAGTKTLGRDTLARVLALGYTIEVMDRYGTVSKRFAPYQSTLPAVA